MKKLISMICSTALIAFTAVSCGGGGGTDTPETGMGITVTSTPAIASTIVWIVGSTSRMNLSGVQTTDVVRFTSSTGTYDQTISAVHDTYCTFKMAAGIISGNYTVTIVRGDQTFSVGTTKVVSSGVDTTVADKTGMTVRGMVYSGTKGVANVVVTDGVLFTKTDTNGHYWLASEKYNGVVYIVLPSGYDVPTSAAMPQFWKAIDSTSPTSHEQCNFELKQVDNTNHIILVGTDWHLAGRGASAKCTPSDINQFNNGWLSEVTAAYTGSTKKVYCLNLGDFAWDIYWYSSAYGSFGLDDATSAIGTLPFQFWSTMGNHDNDGHSQGSAAEEDHVAAGPFRELMGPTNISMNIGKIHYILLDDIQYINSYPGETSDDAKMGMRDYNEVFVNETLNWLKNDLSYVDKSTPIVVGYHCPICAYSGGATSANAYIKNASNYGAFLACFAGFQRVELLSGHTHVNRMMKVPGYSNIYEHNITAICATWWQSSIYGGGTSTKNGVNVALDGCPAGYLVMDNSGTNLTWKFKGTSVDEGTQFKCYDMNQVKNYFTTNANAKAFLTDGTWYPSGGSKDNVYYVKDYTSQFGVDAPTNAVWINVWAWEADYWTLTVTENGTPLTVTQLWNKRDPFTNMVMGIPAWANSTPPVTSNRLGTNSNSHLFQVVASSPSTTLKVTAKDRFGNTYTKTITRPLKFEASSDCYTFE